jgi:hypothetical protein
MNACFREENMELSILIARILTVIYLAAALGGFLNADYYRKIFRDLYENAALTFMMGLIGVILGMLIVTYHNRWVMNWTVLITIVGWLALIRGVIIIAFPNFFRRLSAPFVGRTGIKIFPYVTLVVGLLFGYFGFL